MDYFKKYLGNEQAKGETNGTDTVNKLCERARTSTLLEDRRGAVRALKSLSKGKFRLQVGTQGMTMLRDIMKSDRDDLEILSFALEALVNVMSDEQSDDESHLPTDIGEQFTEIFIKEPENVTLILSMLDEYDFHVRWPAVKLLTTLLRNKAKVVQELILVSPQGVPKLMDLLSDSREFVRNDALLLLIQLTKSHTNIQKILAFENAFERLLEIVIDEGISDGGVVVEDCLLLLLNLLKDNKSNQTLFGEGNHIKKLTSFFALENLSSGELGWSAQKVANMHMMLQVVRALVSPSSPQKERHICQKRMNQSGLLERLCSVLMATGIPADVLTECINTVAEVIRGHPDNQNVFAGVMAPSIPPQPAIVVLLMSMVNDKQPFILRCSVLYCFECFLYKNDLGQSQIIATLLPTTAEVNQITAGQLLCSGLFSHDALSTWFASIALLHTVLGKITNKENLLRVQLATSVGSPPVTLLQQCMHILSLGSPHIQTKLGLLQFLTTWLANCPTVVAAFLSNPSNVSFLTSQVSSHDSDEGELLVQGLCAFLLGLCVEYNKEDNEKFDKTKLRNIIEKRVGFEVYTDRLSQVSKNERYTLAAKTPYLVAKDASEVLFDHEFTKLFKSMEVQLVNSVTKEEDKEKVVNHDSIVTQYKELIREQDLELAQLRVKVKATEGLPVELDELRQQVQQLKDQNSLLKAQKSQVNGSNKQSEALEQELSAQSAEIDGLRLELSNKSAQIAQLSDEIASLKGCLQVASSSHGAAAAAHPVLEKEAEDGFQDKLSALEFQVKALNEELAVTSLACSEKDSQIALLTKELEQTSGRLTLCVTQVSNLEGSVKEKECEVEDLLLLLETNSEKNKSLKERLRSLGQEVSDEEEGELDGSENDDDAETN